MIIVYLDQLIVVINLVVKWKFKLYRSGHEFKDCINLLRWLINGCKVINRKGSPPYGA